MVQIRPKLLWHEIIRLALQITERQKKILTKPSQLILSHSFSSSVKVVYNQSIIFLLVILCPNNQCSKTFSRKCLFIPSLSWQNPPKCNKYLTENDIRIKFHKFTKS